MNTGLLVVVLFTSVYIVFTYKSKRPLKEIFIYSSIIGIFSSIANGYVTSHLMTIDFGWYVFSSILFTSMLMAGFILAERTNLPTWWSTNESFSKLKQVIIAVGIGCSLGVFMLLIRDVSIPTSADTIQNWDNMILAFKRSNSPFLVTLLTSIQAGFTEEIIFRIFLIPFVVFLLRKNERIKTRNKIIIAVVISSILFGMIPTHNFLLATALGLLIGGLYLKLGFIPMVIIHIVGDIINIGSQVL